MKKLITSLVAALFLVGSLSSPALAEDKLSAMQNDKRALAVLPKTSDDFNVWIPIGVSIVAANICIFAAVLRKKK